jgi:hypothetical protein
VGLCLVVGESLGQSEKIGLARWLQRGIDDCDFLKQWQPERVEKGSRWEAFIIESLR